MANRWGKISVGIMLLVFVAAVGQTFAAKITYSVQLVPFPTRAEAQATLKTLQKAGYKPYIFSGKDAQGNLWYAVRVADCPDADTARKILTAFKSKMRLPAFVVARGTLMPESNAPVAVAQAAPPPVSTPTPTPAPAPAAPPAVGPAAPATAAPAAGSEDQRIQALEQEVAQMRQENIARKRLEITSAEKSEKAAEVLNAAGRQYTLIKKGTLQLEYELQYYYYSSDILQSLSPQVERHVNHTLIPSITAEYGFKDNLTGIFTLPFVYKYDQVSQTSEQEVTDLGDISFGVQYQPIKPDDKWPNTILSASLSTPTGRSPYKINPNHELSTGNGFYSATLGAAFSKTIDPIITFGTLSYSYNRMFSKVDQNWSSRVLTDVNPGDTIGVSMGLGYALSYMVSLNLGWQYTYYMNTIYRWSDGSTSSTGSSTSSIFTVGTGWRLSPKRSFNVMLGIGLTNNDPDFTLTVRMPYDFALEK